ncbi:MAG TPA: GNAT family N-acetyltransferase [Actinospica sp.]|nr:GNAT family N-acetyltransferase [Actinospica sp.]
MLEIRLYQQSDEAAVRRICLLTGDNGGDASARYSDPDLLSDIFAIPYTVLEPELCFVAVDGDTGQVVGYIVGTADSARFVRRFREEWLPRVSARHQDPPAEPNWDKDMQAGMAWVLHHPAFDQRLAAEYPAHLHIDLVPEGQGRGGGRALMERFLAAAREQGAPGTHLYVGSSNANAKAFYARLGFQPMELSGTEDWSATLLVRSTAP